MSATATPVPSVLVPGLMCSPRVLAPVVPALWRHGPVTLADTQRDVTIAGMAVRLLASAPERFVLAGHSMGGYVALEVVRQAPERLLGLALLSTSARPDSPEQVAARREQRRHVEAGHFAAVADAAFAAVVAAEHEDDADLRATWTAKAAEVGAATFLQQLGAATARADSRELLAHVAVPTLVLHGRGDRLIDVEHGEELGAGIPTAHLELLDACGHAPTLEQPERTAAALDALLRRVREG